jgi:hypothetical protein
MVIWTLSRSVTNGSSGKRYDPANSTCASLMKAAGRSLNRPALLEYMVAHFSLVSTCDIILHKKSCSHLYWLLARQQLHQQIPQQQLQLQAGPELLGQHSVCVCFYPCWLRRVLDTRCKCYTLYCQNPEVVSNFCKISLSIV